MTSSFKWGALCIGAAVWIAGCAGGGGMVKAEAPYAAKPDQALVVFIRSSFIGSAISAAVYDATTPEDRFIGISENGTKIGYYVAPGEHVFMVVSEAADFMKARVEAGKTYYALVTPRMGAWRARFSLRPLRRQELEGREFQGWDSGTYFVVNGPKAEQWAASNAPSVASKRAAYWKEWSAKPAADQAEQTLNPEDGR